MEYGFVFIIILTGAGINFLKLGIQNKEFLPNEAGQDRGLFHGGRNAVALVIGQRY